jgi:phosphoesterase RecJ-like protein
MPGVFRLCQAHFYPIPVHMDTTLAEAGKLLADAHEIVISTHAQPDGDGLGAEIALYYYLERLGKKVRIINPDETPERYRFIAKPDVIECSRTSAVKAFDLGVIIDTNDPRRLKHVWDLFKKNAKDILILDHHPNISSHAEHIAEPYYKNLSVHSVVDEKSSSIGEMLYRLFHQSHDLLDPHAATFRLSPEIALGLYVSILTDTNSFRYTRTTALSHRIAADMIDFGLDPASVYRNVYSSKSLGHLKLIGEVLARVSQTSDGKIAWIEITKQLRNKFGANSDDTESIVNFLLLLKDAEVLALLREEDDGQIKVSLRSRGELIVNKTAEEFGGGGHEFAAGFVIKGKLETIRAKVVESLSRLCATKPGKV